MAEEVDLSFLDEKDDDDSKPDPNRLGYALRQEQKNRKALEKELKELQAFREEAVQKERVNTLRAAGLTDGQIKYYNGDITPEGVQQFLADLGVGTPEVEEEETPAEEPLAPRFAPTAPVGGSAPGVKLWDRDSWLALSGSDPEKARRLWQEGKVDLSGIREGIGPDAR